MDLIQHVDSSLVGFSCGDRIQVEFQPLCVVVKCRGEGRGRLGLG